ncbi:MAG TPA: ABC-F family ATP-binding cassette domain-containing protein [Acidimicrobiales bacterium]
MILVDAHDLSVSRPGRPLLDGVSVTVASGDRLGLVGINGTGKSTLLGVLAGEVTPEAGTVRHGRGVRAVALDQDARLPAGTVRAAVGGGWEGEAVLDRLGMAALVDADVATLSGGQAKRAALARALVAVERSTEGDLLILDEPTNHLDIDAIAWLEDRLATFRGGLVLVTHDRHVLDRLTTRILELERGAGHVHEGGYASYLAAKADRAAHREATEARRRNLARAELAWLRRGAPARTRKPKAAVAAARAIVEGRSPDPERVGDLPLHAITHTPRLGSTVVELQAVADGFGDHLLFEDLDLALGPGDRLGVVGPNGAGKSTLLDVICGRRTPRAGTVARGRTVRLGYLDQRGIDLPLDERVRDVVAGPARRPDATDAALLERLWFDRDAQWAPVRLLSGGERRRLELVLVLRQGPNVLLLDEPTNDLDLDTLRSLEEVLDAWPGTLVVVSHDRAFLERTVEDVLVLDGRGGAGRMPGGYAAYEAERRAGRSRGRAAAVAGVPGRGSAPGVGTPRAGDATAGAVGDAEGAATGHGTGDAGGAGGRRRSARDRGSRTGRSPSTLRHQMRRTEQDVHRLQDRRAALEERLAGAAGDHVELARVGEDLAAVTAELDAAEEHWLALAEEAEAAGVTM